MPGPPAASRRGRRYGAAAISHQTSATISTERIVVEWLEARGYLKPVAGVRLKRR